MSMDTWQNGSAMWACEKRGCQTGSRRHWLGRGQNTRQPHEGKGKQAEGRREASLPEGHRTIGFHEGTEEADRIQGARNGRKPGAGRWRSGAGGWRSGTGGWHSGVGISARCPYSGNGGMAEWRECWVVRRKSRLMRGESAAGVQPVPLMARQ